MSWAEVKKINSNLNKPLDTLATEKTTALQGDINSAKNTVTSLLSDDTNGLAAIKSAVGSATNSLDNATYGLSALQAKLALLETNQLTEVEMESLMKSYINNSNYPLDIIINPLFGVKTVKAKSHISVSGLSSLNWTNIIDITGKGLLLGAHTHTWLSTSEGTDAEFKLLLQIVVDGLVKDYIAVPRTRYDTSIQWGSIITDPEDSNKKKCSPLYGLYSYKVSVSSNDNIRTIGTSKSSYDVASEAAYIVDMSGDSNQYISTLTPNSIISFCEFNKSLVVRAKYVGAVRASDSIYEFNVGVRMIDS